jgi:glycosyltransferase involved in cell wall biosynthesis
MPAHKEILVFSYYTNVPGVCQAEWVDDRIFAFIEKGYSISLVSCTYCHTHTSSKIKHYKTPALSPHGAAYEYTEIRDKKIPVIKSISYYYTRTMYTLNKFLHLLYLRSGEGRWSWFISAFFSSLLFVRKKNNLDFIYSTGGPPSAHLAALVIGKIYGKKVIAEFEDPLSGDNIGRNKLSALGLRFFEKLIVRFSTIIVYCTRNAMEYARKQNPTYQNKIHFFYPGANPVNSFGSSEAASQKLGLVKWINISYLGSLYQTRNLDTLMEALGQLLAEGRNPNVEVNVYGVMNADIRTRIEQFPYQGYIKLHGHVTREVALQKAMLADVLLLVQHTDMRSKTTIPFKLYDYLHSGNLIFGLIFRNNEIEELLTSHGHLVCQADDIQSIKETLLLLSESIKVAKNNIRRSDLIPSTAVENMLQLLKES